MYTEASFHLLNSKLENNKVKLASKNGYTVEHVELEIGFAEARAETGLELEKSNVSISKVNPLFGLSKQNKSKTAL